LVLPKNLSDQELMKCCRQGNSDCFSELYMRYHKAVFNSILRLIQDFAQAEDLLQEVFILLYQDIMKDIQIEHFGGFSKRVAVNKTIRFLRQNKYMLLFEDGYENVAEEQAEDEDLFEFRVEEVKKAISSLPDGYRTVVNLYLMEGLSHEEIAELLGVSQVTVRTQYHRAKKKIVSSVTKGDSIR
jgi:RNA polymerase sigma factor (sigma-70 family)